MVQTKFLSLIIIGVIALSLFPLLILQYNSLPKSTVSYRFEVNTKFRTDQSEFSLLQRNEHRWRRLEEHYEQFLNLTLFHQPSSNKTIIYSCHSTCYGWGDRLRGMTSVYILALLTRRRFLIDMDHPCSISHVLQPNIVDWRFPKRTESQWQNRTKLVINAMPLWPKFIRQNMTRIIQSEDFVSLWSSYDDIYMSTNGFYVTDALRNPYLNVSWLLGSLPLKQATQESLFPLLFEILFRPKLLVSHAVERILRRNYQRLTCLHIRMGRNPSNPRDVRFPRRINLTEIMLDFLVKNPFLITPNETILFIASDSEQAIKDVARHYPDSSITVPGPIIHIDNQDSQNMSMRQTLCDGLVKVIVEFYILGECHYSLLSRSGFSLWANRRRFKPTEHLYVYNDKLQRIKKE